MASCSNRRWLVVASFVTIALAIAMGSSVLFYFLGRDYFPEIRSGVIQMHFRAPLGTRIEVSARIASLVAEGHRSNCCRARWKTSSVIAAFPIGPHNLAFIPDAHDRLSGL